MDLNRVAAFVRVVHGGSFTAAARALHVPKSSISRSVAQLEEELGVVLLHRTTRKLHLTDAGAALYERASRALAELDEASSEAADTHGELRGPVRVTAPVDLGTAAIAGIVARFTRKHPAIRIELVLTGRVVDLVSEGFDLAVRAGPLRDSSLIARRVGPLASALFASPKYVARHGSPERVADLPRHACVLFRPAQGKATWRLAHPDGREQSVEVTGPVAADDMGFLKKATLAAVGVGLLPEIICARETESGKLVRVLPRWRSPGGELHVLSPPARFVPRRVVVFRDFLIRELAKVRGRCDVAEDR